MKQFFKRISSLVLIGVLFVSTLLTACAKEDPFEWAKETPKTAQIGDELNFSEYITREDGATYTLYVSYDSTEKEKQSALVYAFTQAADYTFEIERAKGEKKTSVSCEISVLPNAPEFGEAKVVTATIGDTFTFENLINASQMMVTPSDLQDKIEFTTVDITYATIATDVSEPVLTASEDLANKTSYTFAKDGVYKFNVKAVNKGGEDTATITVAAYDETKYAAKVATSYAAEEKNLSWTAVTGATGYRVWIGNDQQDVTSTSVSMAGKADGEYQVKIVPVYTNVYYPSAIHEETVYVGAVKTPLVLTREVNTVKWEARPFATSYTVTENGTETTYQKTDVLAHTIKDTYATDEQVTVTVVANFEGNEKSEVATMNISYGTVTLNALKPTEGTYSNNLWKPTTGIQFVEFDGFTPATGNKVPPTYFLVEFTGKNAPNFAIGAQKGYSELICPNDSLGKEHADYRLEWSKAGIMLMNTKPGSCLEIYVARGFSGSAGNMDMAMSSSSWKQGGADASKLGMAHFEADQKYVLMIGGELWTGGNVGSWTDNGTALHLVAKLFTVDGNGTLTLAASIDGVIVSKGHALTETSTKAVIYGNVITNSTQAAEDPSIDPASITFKYWKPASSIADLVNGMGDHAYKAQLKTLLSIS